MQDWEGNSAYALYDDFQVAPASTGFKIRCVGNYSGTAGSYVSHQNVRIVVRVRVDGGWRGRVKVPG